MTLEALKRELEAIARESRSTHELLGSVAELLSLALEDSHSKELLYRQVVTPTESIARLVATRAQMERR